MAPLIVTFTRMHSLVKSTKRSTQPETALKLLCRQPLSRSGAFLFKYYNDIVELFLADMPTAAGQLDASKREILELEIRGIVLRYQCNCFCSAIFFRETQQEIELWPISESSMPSGTHSRNV